MLPFGLKIAWFVLSFTGLLSCWIVLWAFGRSVCAKWGTTLYSVGNTLLQGMFCLGMIYKMDPFAMPRAFCIAQTIIMSFGAFLIAGLAMAFSLATSVAVLKPKTWNEGERALKWRSIYAVPVVVFPTISSTIHVIFLVKFNSTQPTNDMHCESSNPEWVRFLGFPGLPFVLSWPSLYLSVKSVYRVYKVNRHLQRARPESVDDLTIPPLSRKSEITFMPCTVLSSAHPTSIRRESVCATVPKPALLTGRLRLPFRPQPSKSPVERRGSSVLSGEDIDLNDDASSQRASISFPTFTNPNSGTTLAIEQRDRLGSEVEVYDSDNLNDSTVADWKEGLGVMPSDSTKNEEGDWEGKGASESDCVMGEAEPYSVPHPHSRAFSVLGVPHRRSKRAPPSLAPAIWRIILFQLVFISIQFLACISTVIDVLTRRPTPSPLGTHHFALLLAAWGPVIVFGHLPVVRRNLIPWRPIS